MPPVIDQDPRNPTDLRAELNRAIAPYVNALFAASIVLAAALAVAALVSS